MPDYNVIMPSKPKVVSEEGNSGTYEIENLYPGYGFTIGNSLRRILLSSLPGAAVTAVKIDGVNHEFSTMDGVKEDVIGILLNVKKLRFKMHSDEPLQATIKARGIGKITGKDVVVPSQLELVNKDQVILELTDKKAELDAVLTVEKGIGYAPKEVLQKDKVEIGVMALDATFTAMRRVNYEVENMRVGNRTDFNRLKIFIETDGIVTPREALGQAIEIMIKQLKAIIGFQEETLEEHTVSDSTEEESTSTDDTSIDDLEFSTRTHNALTNAGLTTLGAIAAMTGSSLVALDGFGAKALDEVNAALTERGLKLKD